MNQPDYMTEFEKARNLFPSRRPGAKRGCETEFKNFCRQKDWKQTLSLLKPAIERQIQWRIETAKLNSKQKDRDKIVFIPEWPNFSVWINQRRWENEFELPSETAKALKKPFPVKVKLQEPPPEITQESKDFRARIRKQANFLLLEEKIVQKAKL
jgi:hypothetical protein